MSTVILVEWMSSSEAQRALGLGYRMLQRLVTEKRITTCQIPGMPRRYRRADVEALLRAHTSLAMTQAREAVTVGA